MYVRRPPGHAASVAPVALSVEPASVAAARRLVRDALAGQQTQSIGDAALLVSELVTNAIRYARRTLLVAVELQDHVVRVEVTDDDPELPSLSVAEDDDATSGRGLRIVNDLADQWGVTEGPNGKTVWFEIHLQPPGAEHVRPYDQDGSRSRREPLLGRSQGASRRPPPSATWD